MGWFVAGAIQVPGYRMVRALGRGGMGSVFLAEKASTGEPFAVKFLRQDCMDDPAYLTRFEREVTALRSIRHPNVVNVYAWSIPKDTMSDERPYVIMEYLEGEGLDKVLARDKVLGPLVATRVMLQLLDGLAAAHQVGVVHRDLGPSNVFLMPRQRGRFHVKILDFGLARSVEVSEGQSELTQQGTLMGKPAYVAPEALTGQPIDGRCDIFGCGILLFRMLTGAFPYKESDSHMLWVERLRDARAEAEYPAPSTLSPDLPVALDRITIKAMRARVTERYATVETMQEDLLEVESALLGDSPSRTDWSSSHPGIVSLGEHSQGGSSRGRAIVADATPTVGGATGTGSLPPPRGRSLLWGGAAAGALLLGLLLFFVFRGGGDGKPEGAAAPDATTAAASDAAPVEPAEEDAGTKAADAAAKADAALVAAPTDVVETPSLAAADAPPEPADAAPPQVILVVKGAPRNAKVRAGDVELEGDPPTGLVAAGDEVEVVVEARGWATWRETIALLEDRELTVRMRRAEDNPPPPRDGGRNTIPTVSEEPPF
ncbi:MAG: serine/threonine protein kinase [Deltaproteobacteria bacterium]|nr:serine/threonine protein kinase [Deltaproteobacteria bacterium]